MSIEQYNKDLEILNARKEQCHNAYHQILGAIDILNQLIQRAKEAEIKKIEEKKEAIKLEEFQLKKQKKTAKK